MILFWWLLLALAAAGQEKLVVKFATVPPSEVYDVGDAVRGGPVGHSDRGVTLEVEGLRASHRFTLEFRAPGYQPLRRNYVLADLRAGSSQREVVRLPYADWRTAAWEWRWALAGGGLVCLLVLAPLPGLWRRHQELNRRAQVRGETLGPWRLLDVLGRGGMATVYRAVPEATLDAGEAVAVKVMKPEYSERERFLREYRVTRDLSHLGIVRVVDGGVTDEGVLYIAMELIEGQPLEELIPPGGLPVSEALSHFHSLLDALAYAHARGIVHRDLKPRNVMITRKGRVKLMDFGLARGADLSKITDTGTLMGTPAYVAPEQIAGGRELDARTDQYALGVMLFELVTGRRPFESPQPMAVLMAHLKESPPSPREFRPDLPATVEAVILRLLAKAPEDRYPDVSALQRELSLASPASTDASQ